MSSEDMKYYVLLRQIVLRRSALCFNLVRLGYEKVAIVEVLP